MAPFSNIPLSPAELSYLHSSLSQDPPIRPDGRTPAQFRPLMAESDILPTANGSARVCFADGTEAVVGVKAEVEKSSHHYERRGYDTADDEKEEEEERRGDDAWVELAIEIPGIRDDDALPVFLAAMLTEALLADGRLKDRLCINTRFHWRLFVDILLLSQPLSYPLPLLSLTTHLALLSTRLPCLRSEGDEDPLFDDDWEASTFLFPRAANGAPSAWTPPATLLVMTVGPNTILFDPSADELAVADALLAVSVGPDPLAGGAGGLRLLALRTIDPPSRLTAAGVPLSVGIGGSASAADVLRAREKDAGRSVWRPPRGGIHRSLVARIIAAVVRDGGVGHEVMDGLHAVVAGAK